MKFKFVFSTLAECTFELGKSALKKSEPKLAKKYLLESADEGYKPAIKLLFKEKENLSLTCSEIFKLEKQKEDYQEKQKEHVRKYRQNTRPRRRIGKNDYAVSFDPDAYLYQDTITSRFGAGIFNYKLS